GGTWLVRPAGVMPGRHGHERRHDCCGASTEEDRACALDAEQPTAAADSGTGEQAAQQVAAAHDGVSIGVVWLLRVRKIVARADLAAATSSTPMSGCAENRARW